MTAMQGNTVTIESIEKYKGSTVKLTLSEGEPVFLNACIVSEYSLRAGMSVPRAAVGEIIYADTRRRARERALYLLDLRDYSYAELVKKLLMNYEEDICFEVADELAEKGFINDRRYAEVLARRLCETKLLGYFRAKPYMREKGIPVSVIEQALAEYSDTAPERAAALAEKKYMKYYAPDDRSLMQKLKNALVRSGYSFSEVNAAMEILESRDES